MFYDKKTRETVEPEKSYQGFPFITLKYLIKLCDSLDMYSTPYLNDSLYLSCKGFKKIENLEEYHQVKTLYLDNNILSRLENLGKLKEIRCLYL